MEKTILFADNGYDYLGNEFDYKEAKKILKQRGYVYAYSGRKFNRYGDKVLVGINNNNTVLLKERRKNGLYNARLIIL